MITICHKEYESKQWLWCGLCIVLFLVMFWSLNYSAVPCNCCFFQLSYGHFMVTLWFNYYISLFNQYHMQKKIKNNSKGDVGNANVKYIEKNWFGYFDSMKFSDRCILAVVALSDCQDVMAAQLHLLVHWMWRK